MQPRSSRALLVALALGVLDLAVISARRAEPRPELAAPVTLPAPSAHVAAIVTRATRAIEGAGPNIPPLETSSVELPGLSTGSDAAKIAAVEGAVRDGVVSDLPALEATLLAREPEAAPTIIRAVASLAAQAPERERAHAIATLTRWLREETARDTRDAAGNQPNLVEALGAIGGPEAAGALAHALDGERLDLSVQTLAAQMLAGLDDPAGREAIERFRLRVTTLPPAEDELDQQLREEAIAATTPRRDTP